ncbi:MAG: hypothetical protein WA939_17885, partial [Nodosilinea sp.]
CLKISDGGYFLDSQEAIRQYVETRLADIGMTKKKACRRACIPQHSGQFLGVGLEKSYPPHRVQV